MYMAADIAARLAKAQICAETMRADEQHVVDLEDELNEIVRHDDAFDQIVSAEQRHHMQNSGGLH